MNCSTRLAVLIDAENVSHRLADRVFELVAPLGTASVRHLYGNFAGPAESWAGAAARHALEARHCFAPAKGKNGADIALAVGAMDLLRDGAVEGFCIVSSDGDFAALVRRIKAEGRLAIGIGRSATTAGFRDACTKFLVLDPPSAPPAPTAATPTPQAALPALRTALEDCTSDSDGSYSLAVFGTAARRAGVDPKRYGFATVGKLMKATGQYSISGHRFRPVPLRAVAGAQ